MKSQELREYNTPRIAALSDAQVDDLIRKLGIGMLVAAALRVMDMDDLPTEAATRRELLVQLAGTGRLTALLDEAAS